MEGRYSGHLGARRDNLLEIKLQSPHLWGNISRNTPSHLYHTYGVFLNRVFSQNSAMIVQLFLLYIPCMFYPYTADLVLL